MQADLTNIQSQEPIVVFSRSDWGDGEWFAARRLDGKVLKSDPSLKRVLRWRALWGHVWAP